MSNTTETAIKLLDSLPNNHLVLNQIESEVYSLSCEIRKHIHYNRFDDEQKKIYRKRLFRFLDKIGGLSIPLFDIRDNLEMYYTIKHKM